MRLAVLIVVATTIGVFVSADPRTRAQGTPHPPLDLFFAATSANDKVARPALDAIARQWRDSYTAMVIDMARLLRPAPRPGAVGVGAEVAGIEDRTPDDPDGSGRSGAALDASGIPQVTRESLVRSRLIAFLEKQTGKRFDPYLAGWRQWMWSLPYEPHSDYARFKGAVYGRIDERMQRFFPPDAKAIIRLDEIDWGGVAVNGIPPLYDPKTLPVSDARFMRDSNIVFGVVVNGEARAYPKRILAWHEMAIDRLGDREITVVYCTLCGTVIPYDSVAGGKRHRFGTSGLLHRSNKLMFDEETMSLWSTLEGTPVVGSLVNTGLQLTSHPAVTTTWGEWRTLHPESTVLSLETGHKRDYSEGAAYRDYFSHDRLYFQVSQADRRLKNKAEVLVMRARPAAGGETQALAIVADFLKRTPVFHFEIAGRRMLAVTSKRGANRVYALGQHAIVFPQQTVTGMLVDAEGRKWMISEDALTRVGGELSLPRFTAHRAFWFGWYAQYPGTLLFGADR